MNLILLLLIVYSGRFGEERSRFARWFARFWECKHQRRAYRVKKGERLLNPTLFLFPQLQDLKLSRLVLKNSYKTS